MAREYEKIERTIKGIATDIPQGGGGNGRIAFAELYFTSSAASQNYSFTSQEELGKALFNERNANVDVVRIGAPAASSGDDSVWIELYLAKDYYDSQYEKPTWVSPIVTYKGEKRVYTLTTTLIQNMGDWYGYNLTLSYEVISGGSKVYNHNVTLDVMNSCGSQDKISVLFQSSSNNPVTVNSFKAMFILPNDNDEYYLGVQNTTIRYGNIIEAYNLIYNSGSDYFSFGPSTYTLVSLNDEVSEA